VNFQVKVDLLFLHHRKAISVVCMFRYIDLLTCLSVDQPDFPPLSLLSIKATLKIALTHMTYLRPVNRRLRLKKRMQ